MAERLEDKIRDFLAIHLESLEHGLTLHAKEYPLANPSGSGGRVDIVAKDRFGHVVVIEIKRSDQAAREAIHEVHKYTALFRIEHGLDQTQVRVMVVSTDWRELLVPFSEYVSSSPYTVDGVAIRVDPDGTVVAAEPVTVVPPQGAMTISRAQAVFLFSSKERRNAATTPLVAAARGVRVNDFAIFSMDRSGDNPAVLYPFGLYFVFASPLTSLSADAVSEITGAADWDDDLEVPEENFLAAMNQKLLSVVENFEVGYPEKLASVRRTWQSAVLVRAGRLARPSSLLTDENVVELAQAVGGGGSTYIRKITSPRFQAEWGRLREELELVLLGMPDWVEQVAAFLDEIERTDRAATVSISAYNPANLPVSLYYLATLRTLEHAPRIEILVEASADEELRILCGVMMWTGLPLTVDAEAMITQIYGSLSDWMVATHFGSTWEFERAALEAHGIVAPLVEFVSRCGSETPPQRLTHDVSGLGRVPFENSFNNMAEFSLANARYLVSLSSYLEAHTRGLRQDDPDGETDF